MIFAFMELVMRQLSSGLKNKLPWIFCLFLWGCGKTDPAPSSSEEGLAKLVFTSAPSTVAQNHCSSHYSVQRLTNADNRFSSGETKIVIESDSGNVSFYSDSSCTQNMTSLTILNGQSSSSFYIKNSQAESFTINLTAKQLTSAQMTVESLQSVDDFITSLTFPRANSNQFVEPSSTRRSLFYSLATALLSGQTSGHESTLSILDYQLVFLTDDTIGSKSVVALKESGSTGGGTYLFFLLPESDYNIEVPHPVFDSNTLLEGAYLFQQLKARALLIAGTHRCASTTASTCSGTTSVCTGTEAPYPISDVAHNTQTYFQEVHKAVFDYNSTNITFQIHGKEVSTPAGNFSNGKTTNETNAKSTQLADHLAALILDTVDSCNDSNDEDVLCGTTNVQGRYSNGSSSPCTVAASSANDRFIHIEQNSLMRTTQAIWDALISSMKAIF